MKPLERMGIRKVRNILIKKATGDVLEIGAGTGANLSFYDFNQITSLIVTDQSRSKHLDLNTRHNVSFTEASAEALPFEDDSFDTVVHTLVFCSVDDVTAGLAEIKRVLKPSGTLIYIEHVLPERKGLARIFKVLNPMWKRVAGGCNLTRNFRQSLSDASFQIVDQGRFLNTVFTYGIATLDESKINPIL